MTGYHLMPAAEQDLSEIINRISLPNPLNAETVLRNFQKAFRKIAEFPTIGHRREDVTTRPVLFWSVYSYLIVYRADSSPIQIIRIVHGMRDLSAFLKNDLS